MYQPMLFLHWKQARLLLIPFVLASFALPLLSVQGLGTPVGATEISYNAYAAVSTNPLWLGIYPMLALGVGVVMALTAWGWDHAGNHVYALALPVARWKYALLKMGAGTTLLLIPTAALWIGAQAATFSLSLPPGLHAYPNQLAVRFFMASMLAYALLFAMAAGTIRTTLIVSSVALVVLLLGGPLMMRVGLFFHFSPNFNFAALLNRALMDPPGPLHVFTGNWSLIDV